MIASNEAMAKKIRYLKDTLNFVEPEKVPVNLQTTTWPYGYAGVSLEDVIDDPVANVAAYTKVYDENKVDLSTFGVNAMPLRVFQKLGIKKFYVAGDGVAIAHNQVSEEYFGTEFYDAIHEAGAGVLYGFSDQVYKKYIPGLSGTRQEAYELLKSALPEVKKFNAFKYMGTEKLHEMGIPIVMDMAGGSDIPFWMGPFSCIMDTYRGIHEALIDLRRRPEAVQEACDAYAEYWNQIMEMKTDVGEIREDLKGHSIALGGTIMNAECFLNRKNFENYYLKYFRQQIGPYLEAGAKEFVYMEGSLKATVDMFNDLPKGSVMLQPDTDDAFEIYGITGAYQTICAGITIDLLKNGTKEECCDYAKKAIDTFAPGGGFVFQHDKALTAAKDVNIDNFRSVYAFANEYGVRKGV